jgi:hypothetical protein
MQPILVAFGLKSRCGTQPRTDITQQEMHFLASLELASVCSV